jgi:hypothetical protein
LAVALGSITSEKKAISSRVNGKIKLHFKKALHFEKKYPHKLINNEHKYKFPLSGKTKLGRTITYNPDYYCPTTGYYIEVATSHPNISAQKEKWGEAIFLGLKLKVFWWEGKDITSTFYNRQEYEQQLII